MSSVTLRTMNDVVRHLRTANRFNKLAKSCPRQHRQSYYAYKCLAIARALAVDESQFQVDSVSSGKDGVFGITHLPTGRKLHVPVHSLPEQTQSILRRLAVAAGIRAVSVWHTQSPRLL